jgi:hypothetical protein
VNIEHRVAEEVLLGSVGEAILMILEAYLIILFLINSSTVAMVFFIERAEPIEMEDQVLEEQRRQVGEGGARINESNTERIAVC